MRKPIIGVMGPGESATQSEVELAHQLGQLIAQQGWILLTGGRNCGVMDAASQGAKQAGGLTIGILPDAEDHRLSAAVDIAILTEMGNARNVINVLSSRVVIACGMGSGTASEVALALKVGRPVILLGCGEVSQRFFQGLAPEQITAAATPSAAVEQVHCWLGVLEGSRDAFASRIRFRDSRDG